MRFSTRKIGISTCLLVGALWLQSPLAAQQQQAPDNATTAAQKAEPPKPAGVSGPLAPNEDEAKQFDSEPPPPQGPPSPYSGTIKDVSTGLPLLGTSRTPLRWGPISIFTFDYIGIHDDFDAVLQPNTVTTDLAIFRTGIMFDHALYKDKSRIVLQYLPQMAIYDGQVHANAAMNNTLSLGTKFQITPRFSVMVSNEFLQTQQNPLIPQNYFVSDGRVGALSQNNFLTTNGNFIADTASAVFEYGLSPRTNITISPTYRYSRTTNNSISYQTDGSTYSAGISLGHALTARRTVGVTDTFQYLDQTTAGAAGTAKYNTIGVFYSEQLARTFWLSISAGGVYQAYSNIAQNNGWGFNGTVSVIKQFSNRIDGTLAYTRGISFNNYVNVARSDRVDASVSVRLSPRVAWSNGVGYYRELADPSTSGRYVTTDLGYHFFGNFSMFVNFTYDILNSSTPQLLSGDRRTLAYGARWTPNRRYAR